MTLNENKRSVVVAVYVLTPKLLLRVSTWVSTSPGEMSIGSVSVLLSMLMLSGAASYLPETRERRCPRNSRMVGRFRRCIAASICEDNAG